MQDSIYDVTAWPLAWRCHRQRRHNVVLWTTKTTPKSDYLLKIKAWEKNNQSLHSGRDKGITSLCPWFATSTTRQASSWIANHGHSDGIPLSLPDFSDRFYYSFNYHGYTGIYDKMHGLTREVDIHVNYNKHSESIAKTIHFPHWPQQIFKRHYSYKNRFTRTELIYFKSKSRKTAW